MKSYETFVDDFLSIVINTFDPEKIYDAMMDFFKRLLAPAGLLLTLNTQAGRAYHTVRAFGCITYEKNSCTPSEDIKRYLSSSGMFLPISETSAELSLLTPKQRQWLIDQHVSAIVTLKYQRAIIGFLFIVPGNPLPFSKEQLFILQKLCYYSAFVLRNANLYQNAYRASIMDDLTSLYNRKYALEYITDCCNRRQPITLILMNIDDFRLYNELYGAIEADNLIRLCAHAILQELTPIDIGFRYGSDEFLILTDGCDTDAAASLARRITERITAENTADTVWSITLSCGISAYPKLSTNAMALIQDAMQSVSYSKRQGKGIQTVYHSGIKTPPENVSIHAAYDRVAPTVYALAAAIDAKDNFTFIHSMNVSKYAVILGKALGASQNSIEILRYAALLHDIGKISIPEHILKKRTHLTPEEYDIMKTHVENSTKMIRHLPDMDYVIPAVLGHHERYDGSGYPKGLSGENIPYLARILTVADCFDAMTARRVYKQALSVSYAVSELQKNKGTQFDPVMADKFVELIHKGLITV